MKASDLQSHLTDLTNNLARRWAACDDLMKEVSRFSASYESLREKKQEIDNCWSDLLGVYVIAGEDFYRTEARRFKAMTLNRRLIAGSTHLVAQQLLSGKGPL